jgi:hypothetical protein
VARHARGTKSVADPHDLERWNPSSSWSRRSRSAGNHRPALPLLTSATRDELQTALSAEVRLSFAGNLADDPEVRDAESGIARAIFQVAVSGRGDLGGVRAVLVALVRL